MARDGLRIDRFFPRTANPPASRTEPNGEPAVVPGRSHGTRAELASVVGTLLDLGMPAHEIDVIVAADQPMIAHRYIELHGERLTERLADQLQILARIEGILTRAFLDPSGRAASPSSLTSGGTAS